MKFIAYDNMSNPVVLPADTILSYSKFALEKRGSLLNLRVNASGLIEADYVTGAVDPTAASPDNDGFTIYVQKPGESGKTAYISFWTNGY